MKRFLLVFLLLWSSGTAWAFPEAIRHKYNNCITCHVSPTGGGLVTEYGRALSAEIFSTASGSEDEPSFLYGAVKTPDWLNAGGDFRSIQTYMNTPTVAQGRFFLMQADLEAAATVGKFTFLGTVGREDYKVGNDGDRGDFISRRHFVLWNPAETYYVRAGRFQKAFGINTPEHVTATKRGLGWDENTETYNVELSRLTDRTNLFITAIGGRPDDPHVVDSERGVAAMGNVFLADRYKLGASYFQGARTRSTGSRRVYGPWLLAGVTDQLFIEAEADYQEAFQTEDYSGKATDGLYLNSKQMFEVIRGINPYIVEDITHSDLKKSLPDSQGFGPGVNWQPRPHFEVQAEWQKQKTAGATGWTDWAYFMGHYYL